MYDNCSKYAFDCKSEIEKAHCFWETFEKHVKCDLPRSTVTMSNKSCNCDWLGFHTKPSGNAFTFVILNVRLFHHIFCHLKQEQSVQSKKYAAFLRRCLIRNSTVCQFKILVPTRVIIKFSIHTFFLIFSHLKLNRNWMPTTVSNKTKKHQKS